MEEVPGLVEVQTSLSKRDLVAAKDILASSLAKSATSVPLLLEYHVVCLIDGNVKEAAACLLRMFSLEPSNEVLLLRIADLAKVHLDNSGFVLPSTLHTPLPPRPSNTSYLWPAAEGIFDFFDSETKEHLLVASANFLISKTFIEHAFALHWLALKWTHGKANIWFNTTNLALECERKSMSKQSGEEGNPAPFIFPFDKNNCSAYRRFLVEECLPRMFYPGLLRFDNPANAGGPAPSFGDKVAWVLVAMHYYVTTWKWGSIYYLCYILSQGTPLESLFPPSDFVDPVNAVSANHLQRRRYLAAVIGLLDQHKQNAEKGGGGGGEGGGGVSTLSNIDMMSYCWIICGILLHSGWAYSKATAGIDSMKKEEGPEIAFRASMSSMSRPLLVLLVQQQRVGEEGSLASKDKFEEIGDSGPAYRARANLELVTMCWEFLRMTELFSNEFSTLYTQWKLDKCEWLQHALADMSLLAGQHENALVIYQKLLDEKDKSPSSSSSKDNGYHKEEHFWQKIRMQLGCCLLCLGDHQAAEKRFLEILCELYPRIKETHGKPKCTIVARYPAEGGMEQLVCLLSLASEEDLVGQCVGFLMESYKRRGLLGNLLVLMQHNWPFYEREFKTLVQSELFQERFEFLHFFDFIVNMCEEFARLLNEGVRLRIAPQGGFQEHRDPHHLRMRMEKHVVATSATSPHSCLTQFFVDQLQELK